MFRHPIPSHVSPFSASCSPHCNMQRERIPLRLRLTHFRPSMICRAVTRASSAPMIACQHDVLRDTTTGREEGGANERTNKRRSRFCTFCERRCDRIGNVTPSDDDDGGGDGDAAEQRNDGNFLLRLPPSLPPSLRYKTLNDDNDEGDGDGWIDSPMRERTSLPKGLLCYGAPTRSSLWIEVPNYMPPRRISSSSSKETFLPPKEGQMRFWARHGRTGRTGRNGPSEAQASPAPNDDPLLQHLSPRQLHHQARTKTHPCRLRVSICDNCWYDVRTVIRKEAQGWDLITRKFCFKT